MDFKAFSSAKMATLLAARGFVEALTWSFISKAQAELFGGGDPCLSLANPIAADMSDMRPSLLPGLIAAAQRNADRGFADLALFEVGQIYRGDGPEDQFVSAAGLRRGTETFSGGARPIALQHRSTAPSGNPHQVPLGSALGKPLVRKGVAKDVEVDVARKTRPCF